MAAVKNPAQLSQDELTAIVARMVDHTYFLHSTFVPGTREYPMQSARQVLMAIGVPSEQHDQVLSYIASRGFHYCLDASIAHNGEYPNPMVCVWGADQLHSRLTCVL